jgi:hypothetical protein
MRNGNWDGLKGSTINIGLRHGQQHVSIYQRPKCRLITEIYPVLSHFTEILMTTIQLAVAALSMAPTPT